MLVRLSRLYLRFASLSIVFIGSIALLCGCSDSQITLEELESAAAKLETPTGADGSPAAIAEILDVEKPNLKFGFIKLTDCAPLVIAKEKGYFEEEGLNVEIEAQSN